MANEQAQALRSAIGLSEDDVNMGELLAQKDKIASGGVSAVGSLGGEVGKPVGGLANGVGKGVEGVGGGVGKGVEGVGNGVGKGVEGVGQGLGNVTKGIL